MGALPGVHACRQLQGHPLHVSTSSRWGRGRGSATSDQPTGQSSHQWCPLMREAGSSRRGSGLAPDRSPHGPRSGGLPRPPASRNLREREVRSGPSPAAGRPALSAHGRAAVQGPAPEELRRGRYLRSGRTATSCHPYMASMPRECLTPRASQAHSQRRGWPWTSTGPLPGHLPAGIAASVAPTSPHTCGYPAKVGEATDLLGHHLCLQGSSR